MKARNATAPGRTGLRAQALRPAGRPQRAKAPDSVHEHQARVTASAFTRGALGLRNGLTSAAPADFALPKSTPIALPEALRARLETAFAADLAGLQVHADAAAHDAARALGARAFTAGAAIYFGTGAWAPGTVTGRALIAHEVAHALQQTGRSTQNGRWRLEPAARGGGALQLEPDPAAETGADEAEERANAAARAKLLAATSISQRMADRGVWQPATDTGDCAAAVARHLQPDADARVPAQVSAIQGLVQGLSTTAASAALVKAFSALPADDRTAPVRAVYFDAFKALNDDVQAVAVLDGGATPAMTAHGSWSFYERQRPKDPGWVIETLKKHPVAGRYFPQAVVAVARIDFFGIARGGLNLDPEMKFDEKMKAAIDEALIYAPLAQDERTAVALQALVEFDAVRLAPFTQLAKSTRGKKSLLERYSVKRKLIELYTDAEFLLRLARTLRSDIEVHEIAREAGTRIAPIARRALAFWDTAVSLTTATLAAKKDDPAKWAHAQHLGELIRKKLPGLAPLAGVEKSLLAVLDRALRLERGALPSPRAMSGNLEAAGTALRNLVFRIDGAMALREKKLQLSPVPAADTALDDQSALPDSAISDDMVYGLVMYLLFQLHDRLVAYAQPAKSADKQQQIVDRDQAADYFRGTARSFYNLGNTLGYQGLADAAARIWLARQKGLDKSHVGLLGPFVKVSATMPEFARDFPSGTVSHGALKGATLIQAVYALYYENLMLSLRDALDAKNASGTKREFDYTPEHKPIINGAIEQVEKTQKLPRKFVVPAEQTLLYVRDADAGQVAELLPRGHPMLVQLLGNELGLNDDWYIPQALAVHKDGFVIWLLPDIDQLVDKLAEVPGITALPVPPEKGTAGKNLPVKPLGLPAEYDAPRYWLYALNRAASGNAAMTQALAGMIEGWMSGALKSLDGPLRRATNNERRIVGPLIGAQWERVQKSFLADTKAYLEAPRLAIQHTLTFAANIQPARDTEQRLQMTALMLELAPVLARKLGQTTTFGALVTLAGTDRLDIVLPMYAHVRGAAEQAAKPEFSSAMASLALAFPTDELDLRRRQLNGLGGEFSGAAAQAQSTEIVGSAAGNLLRIPDRGYPVVGPTEEHPEETGSFVAEGVIYTLARVHRDFSFKPGLLTNPSSVPWGVEGLGNPVLTIAGMEGKPEAPVPLLSITRMPLNGQPVTLEVNSDNLAMLTELTYAVHTNAFVRSMEDLGAGLEVFAQVLTTALQLAFPEFAGPIAAAEIAGSILQFMTSPEFAMIKGALDTDAGTLFTKGLDQLTSELTLDTLWGYLLFGDKPPILGAMAQAAELVGRMTLIKGKAGRDSTGTSRSGVVKVFGRIARAGADIAGGVERVEQHVKFPVHKVALFVEGSPWTALVLRAVARNVHRLQGMSLGELGITQAADMVGELQQMYLRFESVIDGLANFELPDELVPLSSMVEMVVNLVIDRLPLKYRLPLKTSRNIGPIEDLFQLIFRKIAGLLEEAHVDPNILWRNYAKSAINPYLKQAATGISDEVHGLLKQVPFLHDLAAMKVGDVAMRFVGGEAPAETAPAPKLADGLGAPLGPPQLPAGAGRPLDPGARAQAQRGFGHDFGNVRLHAGPAVDRGLRSAGALAATQGSHVYIDSALPPHTGQGREVLHHELAHVLQQGGPRPLGLEHSARPQRGSPGSSSGSTRRGWRVEPHAEAQADALARDARRPASAPRPVGRSEGLQPKLLDVVEKFFRDLGDPARLKKNVEAVLAKPVEREALEAAAPGLQTSLAGKLIAAMNAFREPGTVVSFAAPFDAVGADLVNYIVKNRKADLDSGLPHALSASLDTVQHKTGDGNQAKAQTVHVLVPSRVETMLEEFFFGVTGVSMDVELNTHLHAGPDGKKRKTIDADKPFAKLKFNYLHLPMVGGDAKLWHDIMEHSFGKAAGDKLPQYQAKARLALLGLQPGPGIYASKRVGGTKVLVFGKRAKDLIDSYLHPPPRRDLPGDAAPPWAEYIHPDKQAEARAGGKTYGQIGLRLGLYKDKGVPGGQTGTDRESHHTVQYLLLEYLVNAKDKQKQPFPNKLTLYPNVVGSGERVDLIASAPGGDAGILVAKNEAGRGAEMPAILLSAHTHTLGDVHVSPKADDLDAAPPSQGGAIHGVFKDALGPYADLVLGKPAPLQALADKRAGKTPKGPLPRIGDAEVTDAGLATAIFNASCKTYTWMRNYMNARLADAIDTREREYYEALVESGGKKGQPGFASGSVGKSIQAAVLTKQVAIFESAAFGFKAMN